MTMTMTSTETEARTKIGRLDPDSLIGEFIVPVITGAPCAGLIDVFFPSPSLKAAERNALVDRAKALCAGCEHRVECFEGAIERGDVDGVWGGELFREGRPVASYVGPGRPRKVRTCTAA